MNSDYETTLSGDNDSNYVVKIGNTVRRACNSNTGYVHQLLTHLENMRFEYAPRVLGFDTQNREILSYIDGQPAHTEKPYLSNQLEQVAQIIRKFHDTTSGSYLCPHQEVVMHNDLRPENTLFSNGEPIALIGFEAARAGSRAHDLAYAAWHWLELGHESYAPQVQAKRLDSFITAYGCIEASTIFQNLLKRLESWIHNGSDAMKKEARLTYSWCIEHKDILLNSKI